LRDLFVLRGRRGASRGGVRVCAGGDGVGGAEEGNSVVSPAASLPPAAARYPTHAAKGASWMGHPAMVYQAATAASDGVGEGVHELCE
jgi:hypothetical protein